MTEHHELKQKIDIFVECENSVIFGEIAGAFDSDFLRWLFNLNGAELFDIFGHLKEGTWYQCEIEATFEPTDEYAGHIGGQAMYRTNHYWGLKINNANELFAERTEND